MNGLAPGYIFREKQRGAPFYDCSDDQGIPKGILMPGMQFNGFRYRIPVIDDNFSPQQVAYNIFRHIQGQGLRDLRYTLFPWRNKKAES
jgi:hypothetical protein